MLSEDFPRSPDDGNIEVGGKGVLPGTAALGQLAAWLRGLAARAIYAFSGTDRTRSRDSWLPGSESWLLQ